MNPVVVPGFLTEQECERLLQHFHEGPKESGQIRAEVRRNRTADNVSRFRTIRSNTICWLEQNESTSWIYEKIFDLARKINGSQYEFDIDRIQSIQLAEYRSSDETGGDFYKSHLDIPVVGLKKEQRKLSISIQLTKPEEYEGGDLLLFGDKNDMMLDRPTFEENLQQRRRFGAAVIFPSFFEHEVTPVTRGTRYSLVAWIQGPNWK